MASTVLDPSSVTGALVAAGPSLAPAGQPIIGRLSVSHSGESIIYAPQDSQGNSLPITALRNADDIQLIALSGVAQSSSFTLRLDNQTTAPIPLFPAPQLTSFVWSATLPQAGSYDLAMSWGYYGTPPGGGACSQALLEVLDSGKVISSFPFDQTKYPDETVDSAVANVGVFKTLGTCAATTTNLQIRLSGAANSGTLLAGTIRLVPQGSTDPTQVGYIDPSNNRSGGSDGVLEGRAGIEVYGFWTLTFFHTNVGSWHGVWYATATGTQPTLFPKGADIQAALQALPNVPAGVVQVSPRSSQQYLVHFTGPLAGTLVTTLVSSDAAFQIIHNDTADTSVGGQYPSVTVNGSAYPLKAVSYAAGHPLAVYHLIQDAPDVQYLRFGEGLFQSGYYPVRYNYGFSGQVGYPPNSGPVGLWRFQALPGSAQYQVAITWPGEDANADLLGCLIQDGLGNTLASVSGIDQSQAPADFQDAGVGWKVVAVVTLPSLVNNLNVTAIGTGTANKHLILDAVRISRVSPRQSIRIQPGDQVSFTAPAGFITTANGPMPAVSGVPVNPAGPSRLPALPAGPKTMKLGMNIDPPNYFGTDSYFINLAIQASGPIGLTQSAAGNPTLLGFNPRSGFGAATVPLSQPPSDAGGRGRGVPNTTNGVWIVEWRGSAGNWCEITSNATSTGVTEDVSRRVSGAVNRRFFQVQESFASAPGVSIGFFSTKLSSNPSYAKLNYYDCDISGVAVYPPDVDPKQASRWRPSFVSKLKGLHCVRFMDLFGTNNMNLSSFSHFPDPANFPLGYGNRSIAIPIASISPPTPDPFADNVAGTVVRVTTTIPHGLATGFRVGLRSNDGSSLGQVIGHAIDPRTNATTTTARDPIDPTDNLNGSSRQNLCHVIDARTLQIGINVGSGPLARMANTLTPTNGYLYAEVAPGAMMAPADAADLCVEAQVEPWVNVPWLADDDCVARMAQAFADRLPRGTHVHVEYGNEAWNYGFNGFFYSVWQNNLNGTPGTDYVPVYITRMSQVHQIFRDVWQRAGRDPNDVRRVCGAQTGNAGGSTGPIVQYALKHHISFDELAPASYYNNEPASGALDNLLTREQLLDLLAVNLQQSDLPAALTTNLQILAGALAQNPTATWLGDVVLVNYEGGPDTMTTAAMNANLASRNHGVHRDPDFREIELYHLQMLQNAGVALFNIFTLYGTRDVSQWGVYEGAQMAAGTGDATLDVANRNDFENLPAIKSETAAALRQWAALVPRSVVPPSPSPSPSPRNHSRETLRRTFGDLPY